MRIHPQYSRMGNWGDRKFGFAFIVNKNLNPQVIIFRPIKERLYALPITTEFFKAWQSKGHAPTVGNNEAKKDSFYCHQKRSSNLLPQLSTIVCVVLCVQIIVKKAKKDSFFLEYQKIFFLFIISRQFEDRLSSSPVNVNPTRLD